MDQAKSQSSQITQVAQIDPDGAIARITDRIRAAIADRSLLSIRGGGSKDFYGEAPCGERLDTGALAGITSYEPSELVVTVGAGTPLAELERVLAEQGQCLAFEPPRFAWGGSAGGRGDAAAGGVAGGMGRGTVGGMVASGLSGPARASVGAVRDYVLGATLINGRAEVLRFGGTVMKNVAGYDVSRVLAGSLGVLGVIAEVSLKVLPMAPAETTLEFACSQADALRLLNEWGGRPLPLNASLWQERDGIGLLSLRLRGAVAAVDAACAQLGGERCDPAQSMPFWESVRDQQHRWFTGAPATHELWRLSLPQTAAPLELDPQLFGMPLVEWHGGQRWYLAVPGNGERLRAAAAAVRGHASLFRAAATGADGAAGATGGTGKTGGTGGIGANRPGGSKPTIGRFDSLSAPLERIHRALLAEFDPHAVFDRQRLYPAL